MSNQQGTHLIVFNTKKCCGTILPGDEPCSFILCFDQEGGASHRVKVERSKGSFSFADDVPSHEPYLTEWFDAAVELIDNVERFHNNFWWFDDDVAFRYNIRLMEIAS